MDVDVAGDGWADDGVDPADGEREPDEHAPSEITAASSSTSRVGPRRNGVRATLPIDSIPSPSRQAFDPNRSTLGRLGGYRLAVHLGLPLFRGLGKTAHLRHFMPLTCENAVRPPGARTPHQKLKRSLTDVHLMPCSTKTADQVRYEIRLVSSGAGPLRRVVGTKVGIPAWPRPNLVERDRALRSPRCHAGWSQTMLADWASNERDGAIPNGQRLATREAAHGRPAGPDAYYLKRHRLPRKTTDRRLCTCSDTGRSGFSR